MPPFMFFYCLFLSVFCTKFSSGDQTAPPNWLIRSSPGRCCNRSSRLIFTPELRTSVGVAATP